MQIISVNPIVTNTLAIVKEKKQRHYTNSSDEIVKNMI